jgi:hypothetical protein
MSIRQIIRQKRKVERQRQEEGGVKDKRIGEERRTKNQAPASWANAKARRPVATRQTMTRKARSKPVKSKQQRSQQRQRPQQGTGTEASTTPPRIDRSTEEETNESSVDVMASTADDSFSGLAGELTDLMAELRDL